MAEKLFPQIPSTVWWGMRALIQRSPNTLFNESMLAASLGVQEVAAKQYIVELRRAQILDADGRATQVAKEWRLDTSYRSAVASILSATYPDDLLTIAPPDEADRQTVVNWFQTQGLGEGSAKNKAATYLLVASQSPNDGTTKSSGTNGSSVKKIPKSAKATVKAEEKTPTALSGGQHTSKEHKATKLLSETGGHLPLNVNVQIHISADATGEQIATIFKSMRKYLYDAETN